MHGFKACKNQVVPIFSDHRLIQQIPRRYLLDENSVRLGFPIHLFTIVHFFNDQLMDSKGMDDDVFFHCETTGILYSGRDRRLADQFFHPSPRSR